mmetsp:Transcript_4036/g.7196  ORF Transcript_4036/g.7196 Transcript_4036/m.7196 type:complete len:685 (+) Transcript_4036:176-2230(+)
MLPFSLRLVYALNAATFQISSLALLSIVNTRVSIPAEYLPAYGAISFLPYSLRPIFAWVSSLLLNYNSTADENKNRHDKLLFPVFMLASLSFVGTIFVPSGGTIFCFFWGFVRGIAGAWSDFLIGMAVIEYSKLQAGLLSTSPSQEKVDATYEHIVSVTTAQSSTARNVGSFVASIATFLFFAKNRNLGEVVANTLLLGTAAIFVLASLVSLKYQLHIGNLSTNLYMSMSTTDHYDTVDSNQEHAEENTSISPKNTFVCIFPSFQQSSSLGQSESEPVVLDHDEGILSSEVQRANRDRVESADMYHKKFLEVSTLVAFQVLLAVSALRKPIVAVSNHTTLVSLLVILVIVLLSIIYLGYRYERQHSETPRPPVSTEEKDRHRSQLQKLPHRQLNLYFLLRYSLPIAGFLMYSYLYTVFESEPMFLQLLSVLKSAIGSVATFCYEKFISPYCHSGWPLIVMIASLDIIMGLVALLDVWVIRAVKEKEVDGEYSIDASLRYLVGAVGLIKYFFAELDYMPALVLSTTNVYNDDDKRFQYGDDGKNNSIGSDSRADERAEERISLSDNFQNIKEPRFSSLGIDSCHEEEGNAEISSVKTSGPKVPMISAGMQYASFLSCIDFGAQIGDWITVPIVASLDITRENHWDHLDQLIIICSIFRMARVVFLWLICPPRNPDHTLDKTNSDC